MLMLTMDPPPMRRNDVATKSELKNGKNINFYSQKNVVYDKSASDKNPKKENRYVFISIGAVALKLYSESIILI